METTFFFRLIMLQKTIPYPLCLGNISKDFTANNMKETGLNGYAYNFSIDCTDEYS